MRRLGRILLNAVTVLSLILFVATVTLWVRSYYVADLLHLRTTERWHYANAAGGRMATGAWLRTQHDPASLRPLNYQKVAPAALARARTRYLNTAKRRHQFAGIEFMGGPWPPGSGTPSFWYASVPCWLPAVAFASGPAASIYLRVRRRGRGRVGLCPVCGYDLRATPGRCPECGTEIGKR